MNATLMSGSSTGGDKRAMNILRELYAAEEELVGRAVVLTDGKAGTTLNPLMALGRAPRTALPLSVVCTAMTRLPTAKPAVLVTVTAVGVAENVPAVVGTSTWVLGSP